MADEENQRRLVDKTEENHHEYGEGDEDSLLDRLRHARLDTSLYYIICGSAVPTCTVGCLVFTGVSLLLPTAMIVIGSIYMNSCTAEPYVPLYLVVEGAFLMVLFILLVCLVKKCGRPATDGSNTGATFWIKSLTGMNCVFLLAWFIAGNYWIYHIYQPDYYDTGSQYCHYTLYMFSFWLTNVVYILLGLRLAWVYFDYLIKFIQ
ncbi:transmembrane protein 272-like [Ptychodera flava]|uniref:transmembrane protein 272-like n=1 Tax=Ptychodera flava TaxID=63121 RepID=UPI003969CB27